MAKKKASKEKQNSGIVIGGCLLLGMGVGLLVGQVAAGLFIGLGGGMIAAYFFGK